MTSPSAKGAALERRAMAELEAEGWHVERSRGRIMWIPDPSRPGKRRPITRSVDFFGAFDLLAVRPGGWRLVQVQADTTAPSQGRADVERVAGLFPPDAWLELWRWRAGRARKGDRLPRGWVKERLHAADFSGPAGWRLVEPRQEGGW